MDSSANAADTRRRFRSVLRLCILVLTINYGHPTLRWEPSIRPPKPRSKSLQESLLKYITTILVRNIEIVAAVAHEPCVSHAADGTFANPTAYQVDVMSTNQPESPVQAELASGTSKNDRGKSTSPSAFTAVANPPTVTPPPGGPPKYIDPYFENTPPGIDCKIVTGKPHKLSGDGKETSIWVLALKIPSCDPLENHVATVAKYVDRVWHKKHKSISNLMPKFTKYIVARSWEKMDRRMRHWASRGFLSYLVAVEENALRSVVEPTVTLSRNDTTLSSKLLSMEDKDLTSIMKNCPNATMHPTITSLLTACRDMRSYPKPERWVKSEDGSEDRSGLYTRDTCFEFHQLLISTLVSYKAGLRKLRKAYGKYWKNPGVQNLREMVGCAKEVWKYGSLLWKIAYSQMLKDHLSVLHRKGWLMLPVKKERDDDEAGRDDEGGDEGGRDDGDEHQGGKIEDEEFLTISNILLSDRKCIDKAFVEWIRLQVDRWQAPRKMTSFVKRTRTPPTKLTLLAVKHPEPMPTNEAIEPWRNTIKDICARTRNQYQAMEVIRVLEDRITTGLKPEVHLRIFDKFDSNLPETAPYNYAPHCEAVLGCLSKFHPCVAGNDALKKCLQNMDSSSFAVSKLCCPVCSELFNLLRDGSDTFHIDGHHHTLFQVELPIWLPLDLVVKLTAKFEKILGNQLRYMMSEHHKHTNTPSGQSGDGLSSDSSDDDDDDDDGSEGESFYSSSDWGSDSD